MTTILVRRELAQTDSASSRDLAVESSDTWLLAELQDGKRAGFFHIVEKPHEREGRNGGLYQMEARLRLTLLGREAELRLQGEVWRPLMADQAMFSFQVTTRGHQLEVIGGVQDGELSGTLQTAGESIPFSYPVGDSLLFSAGLGSAATLPALEPGEEVFVDLFDPVSLAPGRTRLRCVGEETVGIGGRQIETRILTLKSPGLEAKAWIDQQGRVLRLESPLGIVLRQVSRAEALAKTPDSTPGPGEGSAFLDLTAVKPSGQQPRRGASRLKLRILGGQEGERTVEIRSPPAPLDTSSDPPPAAYEVEHDPLVQSNHPRIRAQAAAILGGDGGNEDTWSRAVAINRWVFENVTKEPVLSLPSALDVLDTLEGDCNEHTVLFVALARAAAIPSRIAIGLVWSDDHQAFYYHAWPEVFADRWMPLDPTLGQDHADATHIRLITGNIHRWTELIQYLGKLEIEVLEVEAP
jgi:hypothetical protein